MGGGCLRPGGTCDAGRGLGAVPGQEEQAPGTWWPSAGCARCSATAWHCSALTLGHLLYEVLWAALFQKGDYADPVPMAVCMAVTGAVGYYAASMLLEKSLRVFRGSWRGVLAVCAGVVLLCALVSMDVFGVESRIPGMDQVETVEFSGSGMEYVTLSAQTDQELVEKVLALHRAIVEDRDYIRSYDRNASAWAE
ncbi:MAG: hypothetical protein ACLUHL_10835, partial [Dysosmobacter welbionis]